MRLHRLEISNFRGIRGTIQLSPNGKNFVIFGQNGCGKSSILDALDFLLTGKIRRLTGPGTGGIGQKTHGVHVDSDAENSWVRAEVSLAGSDDLIEVKRSFQDPSILHCDEVHRKAIMTASEKADRGHHMLMRRDLLRFITAEPGTRMRLLQELLDLAAVESTRRALVATRNSLGTAEKRAKKRLGEHQHKVANNLGLAEFEDTAVLSALNKNRELLGGAHLDRLDSTLLKTGLGESGPGETSTVNVDLVTQDVNTLADSLQETREDVRRALLRLSNVLMLLQEDPGLVASAQQADLVSAGLRLLDDSENQCPLCDDDWSGRDLKAHLTQKHESVRQAQQLSADLKESREALRQFVLLLDEPAKRLTEAAKKSGEEDLAKQLAEWSDRIDKLSKGIPVSLKDFRDATIDLEELDAALNPAAAPAVQGFVESVKELYPAPTAERTAWDVLTRLEENCPDLERAVVAARAAQLAAMRSEAALQAYLKARDDVLESLYESVRDKFVAFYRFLHKGDEDSFSADLSSTEAALDLEVDFLGRGKHVPHALHSEGHQDSMGLCLFLAVCDYISGGVLDVVLLDDVLMSIDAGHRRKTADLLCKDFEHRQLIITTHDEAWARQLRSAGVVTSKGFAHLFNWDITRGPGINDRAEPWDRLDEYLKTGRVPDATALLRRNAEAFFREACARLQAELRYSEGGRWDLGALRPAAVSALITYLKKAAQAASEVGNAELSEQARVHRSVVGQANQRLDSEQWVVNQNVHYNPDSGHTANDVADAASALRDLYGAFTCAACSSVLSVAMQGHTPVGLRCKCGKTNYALPT